MVFSMQGVGNCVAPLLAWALLSARERLDGVWRLLLAFGAVPFVLTAPLRMQLSDSLEFTAARKVRRPTQEWARDIFAEHGRALLGTAGSWFLFDVIFYGNGLFQADFVEMLEPASERGTHAALVSTARVSFVVSLLGLPGYWAAIACMRDDLRRQRAIQMAGFGACTLLYAAMSIWFDQVRTRPGLFVALYGASFFFSNFGPNATTFILPACYFPAKHRAVCHGISAAAGKLGALVAAAAFKPCVDTYGPQIVFAACAVIAASGLLLTWVLVPREPCSRAGLEVAGLDEPLANVVGGEDGSDEPVAAVLSDHATRDPLGDQ